jgi:hypothetical protein
MAEVFHIGSRELEEFFERYAPEKSGSMLQTRQTNVVPMRSQVN